MIIVIPSDHDWKEHFRIPWEERRTREQANFHPVVKEKRRMQHGVRGSGKILSAKRKKSSPKKRIRKRV